MVTPDIKKITRKAYSSLEQKRLKDTFDSLVPAFAELQNWQLEEKKNELETTYKFMLRYLTQGVKDPEQHHIYGDLLRSCYKLVDITVNQLNIKYSSGVYYDNKRTNLYSPTNNSIISLLTSIEDIEGKISLISLLEDGEEKEDRLPEFKKEIENISDKLFMEIWLNEQLSAEDTKALNCFIDDKTHSYVATCLIISALTLGNQFIFDENKVLLLMQACGNQHENIRQRALIGLLMGLHKYDSRLSIYPQVLHRLEHLAESEGFRENVRDILLQFIMSRETEKITKKIQEEIIPEMMKISPGLRNKIKLDDLMEGSGMEEKNPEWVNIIDESGLGDKLKEFSELQMEGADIMHSSFAHLKAYPFFNKLSNWFIPFFSGNSFISGTKGKKNEELTEILVESSLLCNSDKYSLFFSIAQMPEEYKKMMTGQFVAESDAVKELQKEDLPGSHKQSSVISKQYIQDLYRFYKIYPKRSDFEDIFKEKSDYIHSKSIGRIISDFESRMVIGEYYFNRNYYEEALQVFNRLIDEGMSSDTIYQKKGFCLQKTGNFEAALDAYLKAELLNGASSWTIKKIAYCYRILKNPGEALVYYRKAGQMSPDNLSIQLNIGHCFLELRDYTEALKCYFEVEYLDKHGERAWRPIAWCSFLTGKYEQAMSYFEKIIEKDAEAQDFLNCGHTRFAMGNISEAIEYYKSAFLLYDCSIDKFNEAFNPDIPELLRAGINPEYIPLALDRMMYE
jgi:tetratricopeptide (TPR) repeat protein